LGCTNLVQNKVQWRILVKMTIKLWVAYKTDLETVRFLRRNLFHESVMRNANSI
jgi:hypothetical protein